MYCSVILGGIFCFISMSDLHDRMFELIIHAKAKAWVFPYKFCSYFNGRGFANRAKS